VLVTGKRRVCRDQRMQFILAWQKSDVSRAALCRVFGISRQTGYKVGRPLL